MPAENGSLLEFACASTRQFSHIFMRFDRSSFSNMECLPANWLEIRSIVDFVAKAVPQEMHSNGSSS